MLQWLKEHLSAIFLCIFTIIYIGIILDFMDFQIFKELHLNEKGDFLAGVFSPLAFLWLVFGYLQQGQELKQNTLALNHQYQELANNVEQQRLLVRATQAELELSKNKDTRQQNLETINAQPFFHFDDMKITPIPVNPDGTSMGILEFTCFLKNSRSTCREISIINANQNRSVVMSTHFDLLSNALNSEQHLKLYLPFGYEYENDDSFTVDFEIQYLDAYDIKQFQIIELSLDRDYTTEELIFRLSTKRKNRSF